MIPLRLRLLIASLLALAMLALPLLFANQEGKSMSNTLRKYDSSGNLAWSVEIENFTGKSAADNDGNIYALLDQGVSKYSPDGEHILTQTSYAIMGILYFSGGAAQDIKFRRVNEDAPCLSDNPIRDRIHIVGGRSITSSSPEAAYIVLDTDLNKLYSTTTEGEHVEGDYFRQVEVDDYGNAYMVGHFWQQIYKYNPLEYDYSSGWYPEWTNAAFIKSSVLPVIIVTSGGGVYVSGEAIMGDGVWADITGPAYFDNSEYWGSEWTGSEYVIVESSVSREKLVLDLVGTWSEGLAPSKIRFHYVLNGSASNVEIIVTSDANGAVEENFSNLPLSGSVEMALPLAFSHYSIYDTHEIDRIDFAPSTNYIGTTVSKIELYIQPKAQGIFAISPDGDITEFDSFWTFSAMYLFYPEIELAGVLSRDTEIQQMLFTADGGIVAKEDDQNISLIDLTTGSSVWSYDTGMQVHSIIPGPDGLVSFEEADGGTMTLSSSPEISGTESQNVQPNGNIIFSQPTPEIDGYQITVSPLPGEITFQGDANIPAAINVSAGSIAVSGDAGVVVPVVPPAGSVQFSGTAPTIDGSQTIIKPLGDAQFSGVLTAADISGELTKLTPLAGSVQFTGVAPDIGGDLTIVKPLGTAQFSADPSIDGDHTIIKPKGSLQFSCSPPPVFLFGVDKSSGLALLSPPATMELSSNYVDINQQTIYVDPGEIRVSGDIGGVGPDYRLAQATVEFPSFELDMVGGASIEAELPLFEMDAIGFIGYAADLSLTFPSLSVESHAGGYVAATMPSFDFVMEATAEALATISLTFPSLGFSGTATPASEGDINMTMPGLQMAMEATAGLVGELIGRFPRLGMTGTLLAGTVGQIEGSFRIMDLNMSAGPTGPGAISMEFPIFDMAMTSGSVEAGVLRYARERIR